MDNIINLINDDKIDKVYNILDKKSKLNEYIIDNNNLLHICAIRGKSILFDLIKDKKIDKFLSNGRGENILHLLLRNGFDNIALKVVTLYPKLLDYINLNKAYPIINAVDRINTLDKLIDIIINKKYFHQINNVDINETNLIGKIIVKNDPSYLNIIKKIEKHIDYAVPSSKPVLINCILNKNIVLISYFIKLGKGFDKPNNFNMYPIHSAFNVESEEILIKLVESKKFFSELLNYGGPGNNYLPLNLCLNLIKKYKGKKYVKVLDILLKKLKNFSQIDMNRNTYAHYAIQLKKLFKKNKVLSKLMDKIIDKSDKNIKNLDGISLKNILESNSQLISLNKCTDSSTDIVFPDYNFKSNNGLFNSDIIHNMMYFIYILRKYNLSSIPLYKNNEDRMKKVNLILAKLSYQNISYDPYYIGLRELLMIGYDIFPELMPSVILWRTKDLYWIDPDFDFCIKNILKSDKRFIIIKVSHFARPDSLHANVIIYDKDDSSYRRFEPYGYISTDDEMYLDKLVMDSILKVRKNKITYYKPGDFLENGKFQSISNDSSLDVRKSGDPLGYCLAWCLWYIELKLNNPGMKEKELIQKAADKILEIYCESPTPYIDFIRDYGRKLNDEKDKLFEEFNIDRENFYNISYNTSDLDKISTGSSKAISNLF
jgi:hypothetical protein